MNTFPFLQDRMKKSSEHDRSELLTTGFSEFLKLHILNNRDTRRNFFLSVSDIHQDK